MSESLHRWVILEQVEDQWKLARNQKPGDIYGQLNMWYSQGYWSRHFSRRWWCFWGMSGVFCTGLQSISNECCSGASIKISLPWGYWEWGNRMLSNEAFSPNRSCNISYLCLRGLDDSSKIASRFGDVDKNGVFPNNWVGYRQITGEKMPFQISHRLWWDRIYSHISEVKFYTILFDETFQSCRWYI